MPFHSKRGDARDVLPAPANGGAIPAAPDSVLSDDDANDTSGTAVVEAALERDDAADDPPDGARVNAGLPVGMLLAGFTPAQINDANGVLCGLIDAAIAAAKSGADGAVTLRFEAGRDGSRRVRIGVTAGGRPIAEPAVFETARAEG